MADTNHSSIRFEDKAAQIENRKMTARIGFPKKNVVAITVLLGCVLFVLQASRSYLVPDAGGLRALQVTKNQVNREVVPSTEKHDRPRAFVCITGQLSRLELENKEQNLFRHWHEHFGVDFDVALVLSDTNRSSVRRPRGREEKQFFDTHEVADYLKKLPGVTVLNSENFVGSPDPIVNPQYYEQRSASTPHHTDRKKMERVQNHIRQFESLDRCYYHLDQASTSQPIPRKRYDILHRIRDDSGYYNEVPFDIVLEMTQRQPKTIVSSSCQQHGGINDRGSFVSPQAAYDYFHHPFLYMYTQPLSKDIKSTESFLMATYGKTCHLVETHKFRIFRIFNGQGAKGLIPGTNFDSENGEVERCLIDLDDERPKRSKPRCQTFSPGDEICIEVG